MAVNRRLKGSEKTEKRLQQVLLARMKEKPFEKITVSEIAGLAGMRRTTFYYFYGSLEELLQEAWRSILIKSLPKFVDYLVHPFTREEFCKAMELMESQKTLIQGMFRLDAKGFSAAGTMSEVLEQMLMNALHVPDGASSSELELFSEVYRGSVIALFQWWMEHADTADAEMVYRFSNLMKSQGFSAILDQMVRKL